jgi:hypothetical protein
LAHGAGTLTGIYRQPVLEGALMANEEDVRRIALSLPETTKDPNGFRFLVREKAFAWSYMERVEPKKPRVRRPDVLAVRVADEWDKQALLALDSQKFFTTAHYNGFPAVLVRLTMIEVDELEELLLNAWRIQAPRSLLATVNKQQRE